MFNVARQLKIVLTTVDLNQLEINCYILKFRALENVPEISNAWLADISDVFYVDNIRTINAQMLCN